MKVILNKCYGGFGFSRKAYEMYAEKHGFKVYPYEIKDVTESGTVYQKVGRAEENLFSNYFTEDFGDEFTPTKEDWKKMLFLSSEHREDPVAIEIVETLGSEASGRYSDLVVVDIPDGLDYVVDDYDGIETLHQKVQTW
jgi:hypothetical protein